MTFTDLHSFTMLDGTVQRMAPPSSTGLRGKIERKLWTVGYVLIGERANWSICVIRRDFEPIQRFKTLVEVATYLGVTQ